MDLPTGTQLCDGKYEIVRPLGMGGSGDVFEARHTLINKSVALKLLPGGDAAALLARREVLAASIRSPNVIDIHDLGHDVPNDVVVIVMDLLEGLSLSRVLHAKPILTERECVSVLRGVLNAIAAARQRGVVHGDLKPSNVFCVDTPGFERVVVLDFGIASLQRAASEALTATVGGTPLWMNPEAITGRYRTWHADTWAVGLLAHLMLSGRHYFESGASADLVSAIVGAVKTPPSELLRKSGRVAPRWLDAFFHATVNVDESQLLAPEELQKCLPEFELQVPKPSPTADIAATSAPMEIELSPTLIDARAHRDAVAVTGQVGDSSLLRGLARILPRPLHASAPEIGAFVESLFENTAVTGGVLKLLQPKLDFAKSYDFFLAALASDDASAIKTITFLTYTRGLEDLLRQLDPNTLKVVIVIIDTTELGLGVRARIAELFRKYKAALIPAFVRDITGLRAENAKIWLRERWHLNRPVTNPFEPRVFDRTLLSGHASLFNRFVQELSNDGFAFGVHGAPGSGKTSIVRMAQDEFSDQCDFYWLNCGSLPDAKANALLERAAKVFDVPFKIVDGRPTDTLTAGIAEALNRAQQSKRRVVVVFDDSDILVDPALLAQHEEDQKFLIEIRQQLASMLAGRGLTLIFIGLRGFMLERDSIGGLTNPLRRYFRKLRVPPLGLDEIKTLCNLGRQVDLHFDESAVERVHYWASGNVHAAQMICGKLLELSVGRDATRVNTKAVDGAATELIGSWESFDHRLMPWLTAAEKSVLASVPRVAFKNSLQLAPLLPSLSDAEIGGALDYLIEMGVVARSGGKPRIAGKLLESWVTTNVRPPEGAEKRRRERNVRAAAIGVAVSAILYGVGNMFMASGQQTVELGERDDCRTFAYFPRRVVADEHGNATAHVDIARQCAKPSQGAVELRAVPPTLGWFPPGNSGAYIRAIGENDPNWTDRFEVQLLSKGSYELEVAADKKTSRLIIDPNWLGGLSSALRALLIAAGAIPALMGLALAFYGDVRKIIDKLLSRSQDA